jgi:hypothetical protein
MEGKEQLVQLKQVFDIAQLIKRDDEIDWTWLMGQAKRVGLEKVLFIGIRLANMVTGVKIPKVIEKEVCKASITRMAKGRIKMIPMVVPNVVSFKFRMKGWFFHVRSRSGFKLKFHLFRHLVRKVLLPEVIPARLHHLFFNKKIRK